MSSHYLTGVDVGAPKLPGKTKFTPITVEMEAGGEDIFGTRDEFHFAYLCVLGDFQLSVRLDSLSMADVYTKAGLMLRTSLAAGAENAALIAFGDNQPRNKNNGGIEFQFRAKADGPSAAIYPAQPLPAQPDYPVDYPNVWLKLIRNGDMISAVCENGRDGARTFCKHLQPFPLSVYLGLALTSHHPNQRVKAVFSRFQLTAEVQSDKAVKKAIWPNNAAEASLALPGGKVSRTTPTPSGGI